MTGADQPSPWDRGDYEQIGSRISELAVRLVETVERRTGRLPGVRVLDLACGTGNAALEAARRGATVTGADLAPGLLRRAEEKASAEGLDMTWLLTDAADTGLPAGSFDVVMSSVGVMMVTEQTKAVAEMARLLKVEGVVAWTAWRDRPDNPFGAPLRDFLPAARPDAPSVHDWSDVDQFTAWLADGFVDVQTEGCEFLWRFPDVVAAMRLAFEASPMHLAALSTVPVADHDALRRAFEGAFAARRTAAGTVEFANPYVVVSAVRR